MTERAGEVLLMFSGEWSESHLRGSGVCDLLRNSLVLGHLLLVAAAEINADEIKLIFMFLYQNYCIFRSLINPKMHHEGEENISRTGL